MWLDNFTVSIYPSINLPLRSFPCQVLRAHFNKIVCMVEVENEKSVFIRWNTAANGCH